MLNFFFLLIVMFLVMAAIVFGMVGILLCGEHIVVLFRRIPDTLAERARRKAEAIARAQEAQRSLRALIEPHLAEAADEEELALARQIADQRVRKQQMLALQAHAADEWEQEFDKAMGIKPIAKAPTKQAIGAVIMTPTGAVPVDAYAKSYDTVISTPRGRMTADSYSKLLDRDERELQTRLSIPPPGPRENVYRNPSLGLGISTKSPIRDAIELSFALKEQQRRYEEQRYEELGRRVFT